MGAERPETLELLRVESGERELKRGAATHYQGITAAGSYTPTGAATYTWPSSGITDGAPPDLPMACDDDQSGTPNHGTGDDRNVGVIGVAFFEERGATFPWTQKEIDQRHDADPFPGQFAKPPGE